MKTLIAQTRAAKPVTRLDAKDFNAWKKAAPERWKNWLDSNDFSAASGSLLTLPDAGHRIEAAVIGASSDAFADGARASHLVSGDYHLETQDPALMESFALGWIFEQYRFDRFRKPSSGKGKQARLAIADKALRERVSALAEATYLVRDLVNMPANILNPEGLEKAARDLAERHKAPFSVTKGKALAKRFPAIHAVGRASEVAPRLIDFRWGKRGPRITLIGKGITFDSGGLDLKPSAGMELMKKDMGGAAHVLGLASAIMSLGLGVRLRVLLPVAENSVSSSSMRPLDVIETSAGIAVEVGNTDAEGRLVLADALHLAASEPGKLILDFATLTGAARVALGSELPAVFSNDGNLAERLRRHGDSAGDPVWPMPLHEGYNRYLDQGYAALSSTGSSRYGGAITAALFLRRFVPQKQPWLHLDVMSWNLSSRPGHPRGGEAMGLRAAFSLIREMAD